MEQEDEEEDEVLSFVHGVSDEENRSLNIQVSADAWLSSARGVPSEVSPRCGHSDAPLARLTCSPPVLATLSSGPVFQRRCCCAS